MAHKVVNIPEEEGAKGGWAMLGVFAMILSGIAYGAWWAIH